MDLAEKSPPSRLFRRVDNRLACVTLAIPFVKELCYNPSFSTQNKRSRMRQAVAARLVANPVGIDHLASKIGQQRKGNVVPFGKPRENFLGVITNPDNLNAGFF